MTPTLRNVRQEDAIRAFLRAGGQERQGKGSHRIVRMPNGRNLAIPSGVLKIGLLKHLIKMADINEEKFLSLL
jgi:predicted RNA binding protein YcfA (HicA-like mRNA interferase family)